jgi:phage gp16-like protein
MLATDIVERARGTRQAGPHKSATSKLVSDQVVAEDCTFGVRSWEYLVVLGQGMLMRNH